MLSQYINATGALRSMLHGLTLVCILLLGPAFYLKDDGPGALFFGGVLPATIPIILVGLMLDILMSKVWQDGADEPRRMQLQQIIRTHQLLALVLTLTWLAVFLPAMIV